MPSDLDIFRSASLLIDKRGHAARDDAEEMIGRALTNEARAVWVRIRDAIDELQKQESAGLRQSSIG